MKAFLFLFIFVAVQSFADASTTKEDFVSQVNGVMPGSLCKKVSSCYSLKQAACEQSMKPSVKKCVQSADGLFGRIVSPEIGKASGVLINSCALRYFASDNVAKLDKKNKKCEEFSAMALRY